MRVYVRACMRACVKSVGQSIKSYPNMAVLGQDFSAEQTSWEPLFSSKTGQSVCQPLTASQCWHAPVPALVKHKGFTMGLEKGTQGRIPQAHPEPDLSPPCQVPSCSPTSSC